MSVPTLPRFQAVAPQAGATAYVHALCGAQYGDLEFDVGKSIRWTQWFADDVYITDINTGSQRYWVVNWTETYPQAFHGVTGINFFYSTVAFRKEQWRAAKAEQALVYDADDWVIFIDAHEGLCIDTRDPQPPNGDVEPFRSYLMREIDRANTAGRDRITFPFYVFLRHDNVVNVEYDSPAFADGTLGFTRAAGAMGTPYYLPYQGMTRMMKVSVLEDPAFDWTTIDLPSAPHTPTNVSVVSYGYAHWNIQDIVPPATTTEPLNATNDDGWEMRQLISVVRPVPTLPYADPWKPPAQDPTGLAGPWAAADQFTADPVVDSGPYLDTSLGTISTPDTLDMGLDGKFRITVRAWLRARPSAGFPTLVNKTGAGFANREYMIYVANTTAATAYSTTNPTFNANVDGGIVTPMPTDKDHIVGFEATPRLLAYTQIVDATRFNNTVGVAPVFPDSTAVVKVGDTNMSARLYWAQMEAINRAQLMLDATNSYLTTPNTTPLNITGDFEVVARYSQADWENPPASPKVNILCSAFGNFQLTSRVYYSARGMMFQWTGTGTGTGANNGDLQWSYPTGWPAGQPVWVRFRFDCDNGAGGHSMAFDYSTAQTATEPTTWTTGPGTTKPGTVAIASLPGNNKQIGGGAGNFLGGRLSRFILRSGIGGTTVLDLSENDVATDSTHLVATSGQVMTLSQATIRQPVADRVVWRFDAADYPGTGTVFTDPRGRSWTLTSAGALVANTEDNMAQPVTPDPSLAGLLVGLYDNVLRINMRDGVYYEGGELGNIPLAWDEATKTWYPRNMSAQEWHDQDAWIAPVA